MSVGRRETTGLVAAAAVVVAWGVMGLLDLPHAPYAGYWTDGDNTVRRVLPESPAEGAGLRVGDYIRDLGGIPVEDRRALMRRPRPRIGEERDLIVERGGERVALELVYGPLPETPMALSRVAALIGFAFVGFGLASRFTVPSAATRLLAFLGLSFGLAFTEGPYLASPALRTAAWGAHQSVVILGFAFLLHFLLLFPTPRAFLARRWVRLAIYAPAALVGLFLLFLVLVQPPATSALNTFTTALFGLFVAAYFGLAAFAMLHSHVAATPAERARSGLSVLLAGAVLGLVPTALSTFVRAVAPAYVLPGVEYYFLTLGLLPVSFAAAVWIRARRSA